MTIKILCVDGGGMRGVGPATILLDLDNALKRGGKPGVAEAFDLFAGTSTGAIITGALAASSQLPHINPESILGFYHKYGKTIFPNNPIETIEKLNIFSPLYDVRTKETVFHEFFKNITLGQLEKNFVCTYYSIAPEPSAVLARGGPRYMAREFLLHKDIALYEAINASSSAPIYFNPADIGNNKRSAVDGGVFADNPSVCALVEALDIWPDSRQDILLVSLGCGSEHITYPKHNNWGIAEWSNPLEGVPIIDAILDGQSRLVEREMTFLLPKTRYFRLQYNLQDAGNPKIDDARNSTLADISACARKYIAGPGATTFADIINAL
jgi:uncharacterized protein